MSDPSEPKPDSSGSSPEEGRADKTPGPGPAWLEDHPYLRAFLDGLRQPSSPPDPQSKQVSIFDILLVTLIAAVILGLLAMLPGGYAPESAFLGLAVGVLVLVASRPNRAISRLGSWALFGGLMAMSSRWPTLPYLRLMLSALMLGFILKFAFALPERRGIGKVFLGAIAIFPLFVAVLLVPWAHHWANIPWWLPLVFYLVATGVGAWRFWRPMPTRPPPGTP